MRRKEWRVASDESRNGSVEKGAKEVRRTAVIRAHGSLNALPRDCRWRKFKFRFRFRFVSFGLVLFRSVSAAISHGPTGARDWRVQTPAMH